MWRSGRARSRPAEVASLYQSAQAGLSLGDLVRQPTSLIVPGPIRFTGPSQVEIDFQNQWTWTSFRLLQADTLGGTVPPVYGLTPTALGRGFYRFTCALLRDRSAIIRIEGRYSSR